MVWSAKESSHAVVAAVRGSGRRVVVGDVEGHQPTATLAHARDENRAPLTRGAVVRWTVVA